MTAPGGTPPADTSPPTARTGPRRGRWAALLVLAAAAVAACAAPVWVVGEGVSPLDGVVAVPATGTQVAPQAGAAALVLLACAGAVALVGRGGRLAVAVVTGGAGVLVTTAAVGVLARPAGAVRGAVADATGVTAQDVSATTGAAPVVAVVVGVLVVVLAVTLGRARGAWHVHSSRHERPGRSVTGATPAGPDDERAAWDALSRGDDPS